jgi:hypothetical protein
MDRRLNEEELAVFGGPRHQAFPKRSPVAGNDGSGQTAARSVALRPRVLIDWPADPHSDPIRWRPLRRPRKCEPATGSRKKGIDDWRPVTEDRAVAGFVPDGLLVGRFEIMDVQHLAGAGPLRKTREQNPFLGQGHVLVLASAVRFGLERLDAALVCARGSPCSATHPSLPQSRPGSFHSRAAAPSACARAAPPGFSTAAQSSAAEPRICCI